MQTLVAKPPEDLFELDVDEKDLSLIWELDEPPAAVGRGSYTGSSS